MRFIIVLVFVLVTSTFIFLAILLGDWNFKSFSIYLNRISTKKLLFKNNIDHPKFKSMLFIFYIILIADVVIYFLFIFYYNSNLFLNICVAYSILKMVAEGVDLIYLLIMDRKYYRMEEKMSEDEINEIVEKIKSTNPNFFTSKKP